MKTKAKGSFVFLPHYSILKKNESREVVQASNGDGFLLKAMSSTVPGIVSF